MFILLEWIDRSIVQVVFHSIKLNCFSKRLFYIQMLLILLYIYYSNHIIYVQNEAVENERKNKLTQYE